MITIIPPIGITIFPPHYGFSLPLVDEIPSERLRTHPTPHHQRVFNFSSISRMSPFIKHQCLTIITRQCILLETIHINRRYKFIQFLIQQQCTHIIIQSGMSTYFITTDTGQKVYCLFCNMWSYTKMSIQAIGNSSAKFPENEARQPKPYRRT